MKKETVYDKIQNYVNENHEILADLTSPKIAKEIGVSQAAVVKYAKKMGYKGFSDFKISKIKEFESKSNITQIIHNNVTVMDSEEVVIKKICAEDINSLNETMENFDLKELKQIVKLIDKSKTIIVAGIGSSGIVAQDLVQKLIKVGKIAIYHADYHNQIMQVQNCGEKDLMILISHSGETKEILTLMEQGKERKVSVLAITTKLKSSLGNGADFILQSISEESSLRSSAMSSRISQLFIIDSLFISLIKMNSSTSLKNISKTRELIDWKID